MKRHFVSLIVGLAIASCPMIINGQVSLSVGNGQFSAGFQINSPSDFYEPLSSYGTWVDVAPYGRCWHPSGVSSDWQPYVYGQWVWTDAGWLWQSAEPWGWATCHYGSWVNNPEYGWCWIPGTEWAPAWVTWREGSDYIGWAPCGPNLSVLAPSFFVFTGIHDFGREFRGRHDFVENNPTIIHQTRVINNFSTRNVNIDGREKRIHYNRGPAVEPIQRATGRTFQARPVQDVIRERQQPSNLHGNRPQQPGGRPNNEQRPAPENQPQHPPREGQVPPPAGQEHGISHPPQPGQAPQPGQPGQYGRPGYPAQPPSAPQQRPVPPTGQEHGISVPPPQREVPQPAQPGQPGRAERPAPQPVTPHESQVPPTGQEHGISVPPQQREVPQPAQPGQPGRGERPMPPQQPATPRGGQVPPTGQEHGISVPPQQREVPRPAQPQPQPARPERPAPPPSAPQQRPPQPTGQEHGASLPPPQREAPKPQAGPRPAQPAPQQEKAPQPQQRPQDGKQQGNP